MFVVIMSFTLTFIIFFLFYAIKGPFNEKYFHTAASPQKIINK